MAPPVADAPQRIAEWRRRGAQRADPLGFALIEALARRCAAHEGEVRRLLEGRLTQLLDGYAERFEAAQAAARARRAGGPSAPSPLAGLHERLGPPMASELKSLRSFGGTWTRLRTEQRLAQSLAHAPDQAGPLNSHALVLRTLRELQRLSPEYLDRYVGYAEALLAIDGTLGPARPPRRAP